VVVRDRDDAAVTGDLYRALGVLRVLLLANTVVLFARDAHSYPHAGAGIAVLVGLSAWTAVALVGYRRPERRRPALLVVDLAVAVGAVLASPYVKGHDLVGTLPGFWVMGVVLAWAVRWRVTGGAVAAAAVVVSDVSVRDHLNQTNDANLLLLVLGGLIVGFVSDQLQRTAAERDRAERAAAAAAERQRLGRVVHDGVLQVLALVRRQGPDLGPVGEELAALAGDQEVRLRAYVQSAAAVEDPRAPYDLEQALGRLARRQVSVAVPGTGLTLSAVRGSELTAVVGECLSNVRHHVGEDAPAWVLLEDRGAQIVVSVRDEGPGIAEGRLARAAAEGRLGVASSIRGRIAELGGTATLTTSAAGTEWEFVVPRHDEDAG
jgi:signal transduction histidine kinase